MENQEWKNSFDDEAVTVAVDGSGNVYVAGFVDGEFSGGYHAFEIQLCQVRQWDTTWNSSAFQDDIPVDMAVDGSGNILILELQT